MVPDVRPRAKYYDALRWIADNDNPGDDESAETIQGYLTVHLVADVWQRTTAEVAGSVFAIRHDRPGDE